MCRHLCVLVANIKSYLLPKNPTTENQIFVNWSVNMMWNNFKIFTQKISNAISGICYFYYFSFRNNSKIYILLGSHFIVSVCVVEDQMQHLILLSIANISFILVKSHTFIHDHLEQKGKSNTYQTACQFNIHIISNNILVYFAK